MTEEQKKDLYIQSFKKWGMASQIEMVVEECSELILAIQKIKRKCETKQIENLHEELADVEIMLECVRYHSGVTGSIINKDMIDQFKEKKLIRLEKRLKN